MIGWMYGNPLLRRAGKNLIFSILDASFVNENVVLDLQFSVKHVKFEILIVAFQENIDFTTKILAQSNSFLDLILG